MEKYVLWLLLAVAHGLFVTIAMNAPSELGQTIGNIGSAAVFGAVLTIAIF